MRLDDFLALPVLDRQTLGLPLSLSSLTLARALEDPARTLYVLRYLCDQRPLDHSLYDTLVETQLPLEDKASLLILLRPILPWTPHALAWLRATYPRLSLDQFYLILEEPKFLLSLIGNEFPPTHRETYVKAVGANATAILDCLKEKLDKDFATLSSPHIVDNSLMDIFRGTHVHAAILALDLRDAGPTLLRSLSTEQWLYYTQDRSTRAVLLNCADTLDNIPTQCISDLTATCSEYRLHQLVLHTDPKTLANWPNKLRSGLLARADATTRARLFQHLTPHR